MDPDDVVIELMGTPQPANPYPLYARLHETARNHPSILGLRFLAGYDDCSELLRSPLFHHATATVAATDPRFEDSAFLKSAGEMLIFTNPPQHTRIRKLVVRAFTPKVADSMRPYIQNLTNTLLDGFATTGEGDLVTEFAEPLITAVICHLVGIPDEDHAQWRKWTDDLSQAVKPVIEDEGLATADRAVLEMHAYLRTLIAARRQAPREDLLSGLIAVEEEGTRLSEPELVSLVVTLLGAGSETSVNLISVGMLALLQNPEQLEFFRRNPALDMKAVEELLRFEPPVQNAFVRVALEDTTIGGEEVVEGELVAALIGAANHDPSIFAQPDELKLNREAARPNLSFGLGPHFCIGAHLARQEGTIALRSLVDRFETIEVAQEAPQWRDAFTLRGMHNLRLRVK